MKTLKLLLAATLATALLPACTTSNADVELTKSGLNPQTSKQCMKATAQPSTHSPMLRAWKYASLISVDV